MKVNIKKKKNAGFIVTLELLLVSTILVIGLITAARDAWRVADNAGVDQTHCAHPLEILRIKLRLYRQSLRTGRRAPAHGQ